jgi:uncharacterized protein (DUF433 family)
MQHERIRQDPTVMVGKPVIKGTRITVELILRLLGQGNSEAEILQEYPGLTVDDIHAAQAFAADYLARRGAVAAE